jgi:hypothetical protein
MEYITLIAAVIGAVASALAMSAAIWKVMLPHIKETIRKSLTSNEEDHADFRERLHERDERRRRAFSRILKEHCNLEV